MAQEKELAMRKPNPIFLVLSLAACGGTTGVPADGTDLGAAPVDLTVTADGTTVEPKDLAGSRMDMSRPSDLDSPDLTTTTDLASAPDLVVNADMGNICEVQNQPGYYLYAQAPGVYTCRKDFMGGQPNYVTVADLSQGAEVRSVNGGVDKGNERPGKGPYGGPDALVNKVTIAGLWGGANNLWNARVFQVTNAQFFNTANQPTQLAFGVKDEGKALSDGADPNGFVGQKWVLQINNLAHTAQVVPFADPDLKTATISWQSMVANQGLDTLVVGLDVTANKNPNANLGRTFYGTDGIKVFVFVSASETQANANKTLVDFGATRVMMCDGGGSTQSIARVNGQSTVLADTGRLIPHGLAILSQ